MKKLKLRVGHYYSFLKYGVIFKVVRIIEKENEVQAFWADQDVLIRSSMDWLERHAEEVPKIIGLIRIGQ